MNMSFAPQRIALFTGLFPGLLTPLSCGTNVAVHLAVIGLMGSVHVAALADAGQHHPTLNLRTGQPHLWVVEFEAPPPPQAAAPTGLALSASRYWVPQLRTGAQVCTWGAHWCLPADHRLTALPDGNLSLADCCTDRLQLWQRTPGKPGQPATWHNPQHPDAALTLVRTQTNGRDTVHTTTHYRLQWGRTATDRVELFHAADGRLLQQSQRAWDGAVPDTITYHWAQLPGKAPAGAGAQDARPWRLQRMVHSGGDELAFDYAPGSHASRLLFNGQPVRHYRYNLAGWLMQATDDAPGLAASTGLLGFLFGKAPETYRYTPQGQLLAWPGGWLQVQAGGWANGVVAGAADGAADGASAVQKWKHENVTHQSVRYVLADKLTVTHTWANAGEALPPPQAKATHAGTAPNTHRLTYTRASPGQPWQQTALEVACHGNPQAAYAVQYQPATGRPLRWQATADAAGAESPIDFTWRADGVLQQLTVGGVRTIQYEHDAQGRWLGVRHAWLREPARTPSTAPLPPDMRFAYDPRSGQMVDIQWRDTATPPGVWRGLRVERDPHNPQQITRTVPYGGASLLAFQQAYEAARHGYLAGKAEQASDLAAHECE